MEPALDSRRLTVHVHAALSAFTDASGARWWSRVRWNCCLASSAAEVRHTARLTLTGPVRVLGPDRWLRCGTTVVQPAVVD
ncbi:hypothetical protein [Streptomyces sp. NPDC096152]|uniref:hypothetical protein n=1 Tax=Streptomyces sp. NPDC096152 TaxID=3366078 RepID=UPI00382DB7E9